MVPSPVDTTAGDDGWVSQRENSGKAEETFNPQLETNPEAMDLDDLPITLDTKLETNQMRPYRYMNDKIQDRAEGKQI